MTSKDALPERLVASLADAGVDTVALLGACSELILCGSRAQGESQENADWDLVAVGDGIPRRKRAGIDLIPIDSVLLRSPRWLESELAWHVRNAGLWLVGQPRDWVQHVKITVRTLAAKVRRLEYRLDQMDQGRTYLSRTAMSRYKKLLRRDLQRFALLKGGRAIPSSPVLDRDWEGTANKERLLRELCAGLPREVADRCMENVRET